MKKKELSKYMAKIGAKGGKKSKRELLTEDARRMAKKRWKKHKKAG